MNARLFAIAMVAASAPLFGACASIEFVIADPDASSDGGTDAASYDEPLIVHFDAASAERDAGVEAAADQSVCDSTKSPHDDPCVIDDALGAFVAPVANGGSDTTGDGTKATPYATIAHAIANAAHKSRVYVCDAIYSEQVTLFWRLSIYGGLSCPGGDAGAPWTYVGGLAEVISPSGDPALTINAVAPAISIEDMALTASNAAGQDATGNGKSSMAAFVKASAVDFRRCEFNAGSGDTGSDGTTGANYAAGPATAPDGNPNDGGTGGIGGSITCSDGTSSTGGRGGDGSPDGGANGNRGTANPMPILNAPYNGRGGYGGIATCSQGDPGANGAFGTVAPAAASYGRLWSGGWAPSGAGDGQAGGPGQGAGGGGGKAKPLVGGGTGGGAGGCGGAGGTGGKGGGASIALACIASRVTLDACKLATADGGNGGKGGAGETGQAGGTYGAVVATAADPYGPCGGGYYAGNGAGGGGGAGGTGGVSIDIVFQGTAPTGTPLYWTGNAGLPGAGGMGGAGGTNPIGTGARGPNGAEGLAGLATRIWQMQ